jgi:DNA-binding response OmpR family regulator
MQTDWPVLTRAIAPPVNGREIAIAAPKLIRLLLVEDNAAAADLVRVYLAQDEDYLFQVEWTPNLIDAMLRLQRPGVDVVLLDLGLPELGGHKSFRAIDAMTGGKIPVVILTADDRATSRELTMLFGAAHYLIKQHVSAGQLRLALRDAVERAVDRFHSAE